MDRPPVRGAGQRPCRRCETLLVVTAARDLALRRAMLPERRTGATLGDMRSDLLNAGTVTRGTGPIIFHAVWI
jgi:hypothetical protein